jgi:glycosyltransferase involved in cell wall biosynthesis
MSQKILFLTTSHRYDDERILYHQALELIAEGYAVKISSLSANYVGTLDGVETESYSILEQPKKNKIQKLMDIGNAFRPNIIICSEPLAVVAAQKIKQNSNCKIIYDVTELYPSNRMLSSYPKITRPFHWLKFSLINIYSGYISDAFIFGEKTKMFPLTTFFPSKKKILLSYFPSAKYIETRINTLRKDSINLCYTGNLSKEKGIGNFFQVLDKLHEQKPDLKIKATIIGSSRTSEDANYFNSLIKKYDFINCDVEKTIDFKLFSKAINEADICFDLRDLNTENNKCLPIKIFYYAASGKPVIFTDLKATRENVEVNENFGYLVNPTDSEEITKHITNYLENPEIYTQHANNAVNLYKTRYNWELIKDEFLQFIKNVG